MSAKFFDLYLINIHIVFYWHSKNFQKIFNRYSNRFQIVFSWDLKTCKKQYANSKSVREIEQKLYQRGVDQGCIKQAIAAFKENEELSQDSEMKAAKAAIRKKCRNPEELDADGKRKLYASLMRKGFSYSTVTKALSIDEEY